MVYYHVDTPANILWHIRGLKRIWIYPACNERFAPQDFMEDIFADAIDENLPYSVDFDDYAVTFDLLPGDVVSWPQNAPHRIENLGTVNVSLSTYHVTVQTERRRLIYLANRFFRRNLRLPVRSTVETGFVSSFKRAAYRLCRHADLDRVHQGPKYVVTLRVDPNAPLGVSTLAAPSQVGDTV